METINPKLKAFWTMKKKINNSTLNNVGNESCSVCRDLLTHMERFFDMLETVGRPPTSDWLTVDDIAKELKMSKSIVYRLIRNNEIEAINIVGTNGHVAQRGHYRIKRRDLNKYIESKKVKPIPGEPIRISRSRHFPKVKNHLGL